MNWTSIARRIFRPERIAGLLLVSLTAVLFWPSLNYEYASADDKLYTYGRPEVRQGLTANSIRWALTSTDDAYWIPATRLSYLADVALSGVTPAAFRRTNILLHALNALLLYILLRKTTKTLWPSALVAALFAVHPLRVESVVWITERKDVLCTAWSLLSILCYVSWQAKEKKRPVFYLLSLLCFFIGLCAKPLWVMLPALLLLLDFWPLGRWGTGVRSQESGGRGNCRTGFPYPGARAKGRLGEASLPDSMSFMLKNNIWRLLLEKIPYGLLSLLFAGITVFTQRAAIAGTATAATEAGLSLPGRIPLMSFNYAFYIQKLFRPVDLTLHYYMQLSIPLAEWVPAAFLLAALTLLALLLFKKAPYLTVGWLWYLLALLPVSGIIRVGTMTRADRFSYLPCIGLLIALVWLAYQGIRRLPQPGRLALITILFLTPALLAVQTRKQMACWATERSLMAFYIQHFEPVLKRNPEDIAALYGLGVVLTTLDRSAEAIPYYEHALRNAPDFTEARDNLGAALCKTGRYKEAVRCYEEALRLDPLNASFHCNLGIALSRTGDTNGAIRHYQAALRNAPGHLTALYNLGIVFFDQGKLDQALELFRKARSLNPENEPAAASLYRQALALQVQGNFKAAMAGYGQVIALQPDQSDSFNNLAWILATCPDPALRNGARAVELAKRAVQLAGESPALLDTLAAALAENGQYQEADATAGRALDLLPGWNDGEFAKELRSKQELYRSGTPYHQAR